LPAFLVDGILLLDAGTIGSVLNLKAQSRIRDILITHAHLDHIKAIPFFADNLSTCGFYRTVSVRSTREILNILKENLFNGLVWPDFSKIPTTKKPAIRFEALFAEKAVQLVKHRVTAFSVDHKSPALAFLVENGKGKRVLYTGDTGPTERIWKVCSEKPLDAVIAEVTYPNRMSETAIQSGHLTPELLAWEMRKIRNASPIFLISHSKPLFLAEIKRELEMIERKGVEILQDGQVIDL